MTCVHDVLRTSTCAGGAAGQAPSLRKRAGCNTQHFQLGMSRGASMRTRKYSNMPSKTGQSASPTGPRLKRRMCVRYSSWLSGVTCARKLR